MSELKVIDLGNIRECIEKGKSVYYEYYAKSEADKVIAELKVENERLKATPEQIMKEVFDKVLIYPHDMVRLEDAYKLAVALRTSRRTMWMARAERAKEKQQLFHFSLGYEKLCIDGFYDPYSGRRELSPKQWIKAFNKVEVKLLKKAEDYK